MSVRSVPLPRLAPVLALLAAAAVVPLAPAAAQGYRARIDVRAQTAAFRGVVADSIPREQVVTGPDGSLFTPDGIGVTCGPFAYCRFYRPGDLLHAAPLTTRASASVWGLGLPGLRLHADARVGVDLGDDVWPGTDPAVHLLEAFAEYATPVVTGRAGRQVVTNRLGIIGFDGARAIVRIERLGLEVDGYLGWGLARGIALPVTSPALNPLDEFQPRDRQILAGAALGWTGRLADARLDYQREVDPGSDYFVSERVALSGVVRPFGPWSVVAALQYDLAFGWLGTSEASLRYTTTPVTVIAGARHYRPHFDLWTIWGAFSPVAHDELHAAAWVRPVAGLELRARGELFRYEETEAETPLSVFEDDGWRLGVGASWSPDGRWTFDGGYLREFGPGAAAESFDAAIAFAPSDRLTISAFGSLLERPLEFRYYDADVRALGADVDWQLARTVRVGAGAAHFWEARERPDAAAVDWDQTRVYGRVTLLLNSGADRIGSRAPGRIRPRLVR